MEKLLCPSLLNLSDDCLRDEVRALDRSGADILHLDVMDGDYVPNFGMSFNEIATVRANTGLPLDLHMTMRNPGGMCAAMRRAGWTSSTFTRIPRPCPPRRWPSSGTWANTPALSSTPAYRWNRCGSSSRWWIMCWS